MAEPPGPPLDTPRGAAPRSTFGACCPRCGQGRLYAGFVTLAPACDRCGLDYSFADAGDGPAVFVILIAGVLALGATLWVEFTFEPPYWVHLAVSLPLTLGICLGLLRPIKTWLVATQYRTKAEQGRIGR